MDWNRLPPALRKWKYQLLLASMLLLAVFHPVMRGQYVGQKTFDGLFSLVLVAAIFAVSRRGLLLPLALLLGIPALGVTWITYLTGDSSQAVRDLSVETRLLGHLTFLVFAVVLVLYDVLQGTHVTRDKLCGAVCVYLLLGVIWALLYSLVRLVQPGAFLVGHADPSLHAGSAASQETFSLLLYYSYVTLSTLGYGDVMPVSPAARTLAWMEAVTGQLYLAVLIARLVGLHIAGRTGGP